MREISTDQLAAALETGGVVVDVREPDEYRSGHVPGALNIPMGHLSARMRELDRAQPVNVICASGNRSKAMTELLAASGFDAASVAGGTTAWARSGRTVEEG